MYFYISGHTPYCFRGFHETMNSLDAAYTWITPLSSAGLVYFHYGHRVLAEIIGCDESDDIVKRIFMKFYTDFVEAVDGFDNGILPSDEEPGYALSFLLQKYRQTDQTTGIVPYFL